MLMGIQQVIFWAGIGLITLVLLRLGISCLRGFSRWWREGRTWKLEQEFLQARYLQSRRLHTNTTSGPAWAGLRKFVVKKIVAESPDCRSFYFVPEDGKPLPSYLPGQHLTFSLNVPQESRPVMRCYSLSERPKEEWYRCTIKYERGNDTIPDGKASSYFHEHVREGDRLDVKAPGGYFVLDIHDPKPVVLMAAGIGITPLFSMLSILLHHGWKEPVYLFFSVRDKRHHLYKQTLHDLSVRHRNFKLIVNYTAPAANDQPDVDYQFVGRLTEDDLRARLPSTNFQFYLCGPGGYVASMFEILGRLGVPERDIHTESFGRSSRAATKTETIPTATSDTNQPDDGAAINFSRTGTRLTWDAQSESLLDFAEKHGVPIDSSCRAGSCGSCLTKISSGKVKYKTKPCVETEPNECLPCVSLPDGELALEA
ncbi:MAG: FAD/NAD(P)-binding oxidoreductase [Planctomyces sp.]|nr:FAD/NAD(P)-binding oxidoreductase [Planctomyces sp.]